MEEKEDIIFVAIIGQEGEITGVREIGKGNSELDKITQEKCYLGNLNSHDNYSLMIEVFKYYDVIEENEVSIAEGTFAYVNENELVAPREMDIIIDLSNHSVSAKWGKYARQNEEGWIFAVKDGSLDDFYVELSKNETAYTVFFNPNATEIIVELSYRIGDRVSSVLSKKIKI